jgi:hypothetical protein
MLMLNFGKKGEISKKSLKTQFLGHFCGCGGDFSRYNSEYEQEL